MVIMPLVQPANHRNVVAWRHLDAVSCLVHCCLVQYLHGFVDVVAYNDECGMQLTKAYETKTSCNQ